MSPFAKGKMSTPSHSSRFPVGGGRVRGPLADDDAVAHVEPTAAEREVGPVLEDPRDVRPDVVALDPLARGVVLEDHPGSVQSHDRVDVVRVPGVVVALDQPLELGRGVHAREYRVVRRH